MENIKDYIINILKKDGDLEDAINVVLQMSEERLQWFKDVAWNLARVTGKYDRLATTKGLSILERLILIKIETEESEKWNEECQREHDKWLREHEEWLREFNKKQASASMNYSFPIGEA